MQTSGQKIEAIVKREITITFENNDEYRMFTRLMTFDLSVPEVVYDDVARIPLGNLMRQIYSELVKIK